MEYLKPIEQLQQTTRRYQVVVLCLIAALALSITLVPIILRGANPLLVEEGGIAREIATKPWKLTVTRFEGFAKAYLADRFEWTVETFSARKTALSRVTTEPIFAKLKDSLSTFEQLASAQHAVSYFVLEGLGISNAKHVIEARIIRVIRIKSAAFATPLVIRLGYEEAAISEQNPYGLLINDIEEVQPPDVEPKTEEGKSR